MSVLFPLSLLEPINLLVQLSRCTEKRVKAECILLAIYCVMPYKLGLGLLCEASGSLVFFFAGGSSKFLLSISTSGRSQQPRRLH